MKGIEAEDMEIVRMREEHTEILAELERQCFSKPWSQKALLDEVENPSACFLVAVADGRVAGYGGMHCVCGQCYLANLAVSPEYRRQGIGAALLAALEKEARSRGGEFLSLEVRPSNCQAIGLYTKLGFEEAGRRRDFYRDPREDALILTKRFERARHKS